jgi:MoxR-like ATPase
MNGGLLTCRRAPTRHSCSGPPFRGALLEWLRLVACLLARNSSLPPCRHVDGKRVFEFRDGRVTDALRQGRWILLDELNLAPPDVLQSLAPLLDRCAMPSS